MEAFDSWVTEFIISSSSGSSGGSIALDLGVIDRLSLSEGWL